MLDIIIPVYNEGENVEELLNGIGVYIHPPKTVYFIYDYDEDTTVDAVRRIQTNYDFKIYLLKNIMGRGVLNAIKTGLAQSSSPIILFLMGDLSDSPAIINAMYHEIKCNGFDIVCGSRYMRGGKQIGGDKLKKMLSKLAGVSLKYLIGMPTHDITNNFKMYRRRVINEIEIESTGGFEISMEITIKAFLKGFRITEVPSTWQDRHHGRSHFKMVRWLPHYMKWYVWALAKYGLPRILTSIRR